MKGNDFLSIRDFTPDEILYFLILARQIKAQPPKFDASNLVAEQHEAVSSDGTRKWLLKTHDGHEPNFQVNHLAPFLLTNLLRDQLSGRGRVITVTAPSSTRVAAGSGSPGTTSTRTASRTSAR